MKILIQPIGGFFPMNEEGFVLNDAKYEKVKPHWHPILEIIIATYQKQLSGQLHSIYLRGSIARGKESQDSDIDTFALIHQEGIRWKPTPWQANLESKLKKDFSIVKDLETMVSSYYEDIFAINPRLCIPLKTQSICLWGESVIDKIPPFKPSKAMMMNYSWMTKEVNKFLLKSEISPKECQEMMKIIIRTGFELVMERQGKYTTDLYWAYDAFAQYYPDEGVQMRQALEFYLNPKQKTETLQLLVNELGKWLSNEIKLVLKT